MNPSYGPVEVKLFGTVYPDGETVPKGKITLLGESPFATARLYVWQQPTNGLGRFREFDTLTDATIKEGIGMFTMTGISQQLVNDVGLTGDEARVTWEVFYEECSNC